MPPNKTPPVVAASAPTPTLPGNRCKVTRARNKRRKESKKLKFLKSKGILLAAATKSDLRKFEEGTTQSQREEMIAAGGILPAFEAKRQALLTSIAAGGVDIGLDPSLQRKDNGMVEDGSPVRDPLSKATAAQDDFVIDHPSREDGPRKLWPEKLSGNDPTSTSTTAVVQDSVTAMPAKAKEIPLTDSISTTSTGIVPESHTAVEAMESLKIQSSPGAVEASKSMTTPAPEPQHRRSKLDVSGAKRMLFGSLGLRTPKTKDDELKTREKLMKDVRPVREPHVTEETETVEDVAAAADDESWKDKIDLRAVECCYEGIELSTPPFPFVQRWDPQQQKGYSMGNAKNRKGKKRKRNNNDGSFFNPKNKAVRLDEDDWNRQEAGPEPSAENDNVESNDERVEDSVRANEQLLHETEGASADTLVEVEDTHDLTDDLPTLPEDITICLPLTLEKATKGNIVAFKQLEMSVETNWQPKISEYRTAIVDEILDDGTLSLKLAKRDQPLKNTQYDEETGERLYSKFEMPGYHDEIGEGQNGNLEISFDELINPVLVEVGGGKGDQDVILQDRGHSVAHTDSNDKAITEEAHDIDAGAQGVSHDGPIREESNNAAADSGEEARQEISELIRDAGWRSSINCELTDRQDEEPAGQNDQLDDPALMGTSSPKFRDFSSSPVTNGFQVASSPPPAVFQTLGHVHASGSEIAESVSPQRRSDSPARSNISNHRSPIEYPDLPQINDDSEVLQQEAQDRSGLPEIDHQIGSQDLNSSSSIRHSLSPGIGSHAQTSHEKRSQRLVHVIDGADSDESLPELFSQAFEKRVSQGRDIKSELSEGDSVSPPSHRKSKRNNRIIFSQRESDRDWEPDVSESEHEDEGESTPRQPQSAFSSQIMDMTISSDTVDPADDSYVDDDSYVLPKGPGWVHKPGISEPRNGPTKETTRGSRRRR